MQFEIEKMVYGGDGLARMPADAKGRGKAVFVPFVLPGEQVEASVIESRSGFARARLDRILTPAAERVEPQCPYFGRCGGCHYQHARYPAQLKFKTEILRETVRRTAKLELEQEIQVHPSEPWNYRNRTRMRVQHAPDFALGYFRHGSHELMPVESCPISSPLINRAIAAVWKLGRAKSAPQTLHGLQFFANHDDTQLLVEAYVRTNSSAKEFEPFATALREALPQAVGVVVFATSPIEDESRQHAPLSSVHVETSQSFGSDSLVYQAMGHRYRVSGGSFFQTNRFMVEELAKIVTAGQTGRAALDLYAGAGLFTLPLAQSFDDVVAVEASPNSFADLRLNAPANVLPIPASTESFFTDHRAAKNSFDLVVVDPPRAGLGERTAAALGRMSVPRVIYVSCDPATLSRDLQVLLKCGFRVEQAHLVDLFPQTFHMETVLHLVR